MSRPPPPWPAALRWALSLGVLAAVAFALRGRVGAAAGAGVPWPHPLAVAGTTVVFVVANEILVRAWLRLVRLGGATLPLATARWVWSASQLARYTVGMAQVAGRAIVARRHGLTAAAGAVTTLLEVGWYVAINAALAAVTARWWLGGEGLVRWAAVLVGVVLAAAALPLVAPQRFLALVARAARLRLLRRPLGRLAAPASALVVTRRDTMVLSGRYLANASVRLAGFLLLYAGLGGPSHGGAVLTATGAYALGHLVGAVAVFAPGGVGPREGVTAIVVAPLLGAGGALMLVAANRLLELLAELLYTGAARLARPGRDRPAAETTELANLRPQ